MAKRLSTVKIVIWMNHHVEGPVEYAGKSIKDSKSILKYKERIQAIIDLPRRKERLFGEDVRELLACHQTFAEGLENKGFNLFSRQRLSLVQRDSFKSLDDSGLL